MSGNLLPRGALRRVIMKKDPIVEEIREIRKAHAKKFNFQLDAIFADLKEKEKLCEHPVVSLPAKHRQKATGS